MTQPDPDAIGPDYMVQPHCYLPMADVLWGSASCNGLAPRRLDNLFSRHAGCRNGRRGQTVTQHQDAASRVV
jgi:hypothetical protein